MLRSRLRRLQPRVPRKRPIGLLQRSSGLTFIEDITVACLTEWALAFSMWLSPRASRMSVCLDARAISLSTSLEAQLIIFAVRGLVAQKAGSVLYANLSRTSFTSMSCFAKVAFRPTCQGPEPRQKRWAIEIHLQQYSTWNMDQKYLSVQHLEYGSKISRSILFYHIFVSLASLRVFQFN